MTDKVENANPESIQVYECCISGKLMFIYVQPFLNIHHISINTLFVVCSSFIYLLCLAPFVAQPTWAYKTNKNKQ